MRQSMTADVRTRKNFSWSMASSPRSTAVDEVAVCPRVPSTRTSRSEVSSSATEGSSPAGLLLAGPLETGAGRRAAGAAWSRSARTGADVHGPAARGRASRSGIRARGDDRVSPVVERDQLRQEAPAHMP